MDDDFRRYLRRIGFEKIKGELRAFVQMFDFVMVYDGTVFNEKNYENRQMYEECDRKVEEFIKYVEENLII